MVIQGVELSPEELHHIDGVVRATVAQYVAFVIDKGLSETFTGCLRINVIPPANGELSSRFFWVNMSVHIIVRNKRKWYGNRYKDYNYNMLCYGIEEIDAEQMAEYL